MLKIEDRNKKIYMNCNTCGKCCDGGISLTFDECFQYQDDFIIGLLWRLQKNNDWFIGSEDSPSVQESKLISEKTQKMFATISDPRVKIIKDNYFIQVFPYAAGYKKFRGDRRVCSKLNTDNTCSIYKNRPLMCRTLPLQSIWPEKVQWHSLRHFSFYQDCLSTKKEEYGKEIFDNEVITDPVYAENLEKMSKAVELDSILIKDFFDLSIKDKSMGYDIPIKELLESYEKQSHIETNLAFIIPFLYQKNINSDKLINFFKSQIKLISDEISKALQRKNPDERKYTQNLRSYIDIYSKILHDRVIENMFYN